MNNTSTQTVSVSRVDFITSIKNALDRSDFDFVRAAVELSGGQHPDVSQRALAALAKIQKPVLPLTGFYTVVLEDGHLTFKVSRQEEGAAFAPGQLIVSLLIRPENEAVESYISVGLYKPTGEVVLWRKHRGNKRLIVALRILGRDPKAAGLGYARASGRCWRCGRLLTTPESIEAGIGPVCRDK